MKCYLVGGCVRDAYLGLPPADRDWVVVGATEEEMLAKGFVLVGRGFPVFLHPDTHEEYALARTEKKQGHGYRGFTIYSTPQVSLIDDLRRRDLTINAIAQSVEGEYIDPFGGRKDLDAGVLRHVSEAFLEDPLRVLRVARFAARFPSFEIATDTWTMMLSMREELSYLVPDRIGQEFMKVMSCPVPSRFFEILDDLGAWPFIEPIFEYAMSNSIFLSILSQLSTHTLSVESRCIALLSALSSEEIMTVVKRWALSRRYEHLAVSLSTYWRTEAHTPVYYQNLFEKHLKIRHHQEGADIFLKIIESLCQNGAEVSAWLRQVMEVFLMHQPATYFQSGRDTQEALKAYQLAIQSAVLIFYPEVLPLFS